MTARAEAAGSVAAQMQVARAKKKDIGLAVIELGTNDSRVEGSAPDFEARHVQCLAVLRAE